MSTLTLPAGPEKLLLLDIEALKRNTERPGRGAPAVCVAVLADDSSVQFTHRGFNARTATDAVVKLHVFPRGHKFQKLYYAAWATDGEVVLDVIGNPAPASAPTNHRPAKPVLPKPKVKP